ncbi:MAG: substrate-binding domain-containing protein [Ilumatobacteraceae bacterium]|jgi:simple sugar transport system substrate-binding protein|nr:substrate-binding domain-containing protein [Actinomycetota bacterium]MDA2974487.1 substrate-binding domain-containing protein [Actinomycetota bacterium]MDA3010443.1 substrate-binding domain-containing protein [Actinomycetota bacterium]
MRKLRTIMAPIAALAIIATACGSDDTADAPAEEPAAAAEPAEEPADEVAATQGGDITFHMVTHSDDGPFWSVVKRGMEAACEDTGVNCVWLGSNNDPGVQVQMIEQAIAEGSSGIASALASPDQLVGPLQEAVGNGIPVVTLNSGLNNWQEIGALSHVGQDEIIAGRGAGERFNALGATKVLCGRQEESNVALEERCNGVAETFNGEVVSQFVGLDADQTEQTNSIAAVLAADPAIDAFIGTGPVIAMSGLAAANDSGRELLGIGGFDMTPELLGAIDAGDVSFTIDQQQYLQGYLPIVLLYLNVTNANTAGGGQPVLSGPGFVDQSNAAQVATLVDAGTR